MNETEAQTAAGSLVAEMRSKALELTDYGSHIGAGAWFEAAELAERYEATRQAERTQLQAAAHKWECEAKRNSALLASEMAERQAERDRLQAEFDKARASERALRRERKGEVWYWQGDEYDHLESLTCPVLIEAGDLREIVVERDRLNYEISLRKAAYQEYIDAHKKEKDRADRAEQAGAERDRLQSRITKLEHQAAERNAGYDALFRSCEAHRERADRCEGALVADRRAIGNLLARIFGDGGHRQQAIGDVTAACAEAESVVLAERQPLVDLRAGVESVAEALHNRAVTEGRYGNPHMTFQGFADRLTALMAASSAAGAEGAGGAEEEGKP